MGNRDTVIGSSHFPTGDGLSKTRLEAFSDGVFSIAITLLVLDVHIPAGLKGDALTLALGHLWPRIASFALSFVIIGVYWVGHHIMLHSAQRTDRTLLWLNNLCLLFVAFITASAAMLGSYHERRVVLWYGMNLILTSGSLDLFWTYIVRRLGPGITPEMARRGHQRTRLSMAIYAAACGLAFVDTRLSIALYWLGPLLYIILQSSVDDRLVAREVSQSAGDG